MCINLQNPIDLEYSKYDMIVIIVCYGQHRCVSEGGGGGGENTNDKRPCMKHAWVKTTPPYPSPKKYDLI